MTRKNVKRKIQLKIAKGKKISKKNVHQSDYSLLKRFSKAN